MSEDTYIPLSEIVNAYIRKSDAGSDSFVKFYDLAKFCMTNEVGIDFAAGVNTVVLPILSNKTAVLPPDFKNYVRIGILNENGKIVTLTRNDSLTFNLDGGDDRLGQPILYQNGWIDEEWNAASDYLLYNIPSTYFGTGSNINNGEFRIDKRNSIIVFDFHFNQPSVILEYTVNLTLEDGDYYVDSLLAPAIEAYINWGKNAYKDNVPPSVKDYAWKQFCLFRSQAIMRMDPIDIDQLCRAIRKYTMLAPRT